MSAQRVLRQKKYRAVLFDSFGVRVPVAVLERVEAIAQQRGRSRNSIINDAIQLFLEIEADKAKTPAA